MFTRQFWISTAERTIKTFAQTLAAVLVTGGVTMSVAGWKTALSAAALAAVVSVLTSIGSLKIGPADSPSVVRTEPTPAPVPQPVPATPVVPIQPVPATPAAPEAVPAPLPAAA